jgi:hypothetical protein
MGSVHILCIQTSSLSIEWVWIGNCIYWTLSQLEVTIALSLIHTLCSSLQHVLSLLSLLCLHQSLSGNGFRHHRSLNFRVHILTGRRMSHNWLNSGLVMLITRRQGPHIKHRFQRCYCCVTQLSQERRREHCFPFSPLVRVRNLLPISGRCLQSHYLATDLQATILSSHICIGLPSGLCSSGLPTKSFYALWFSTMNATYPTNLFLLDLFILIILGEKYKLRSSSLWCFLILLLFQPS